MLQAALLSCLSALLPVQAQTSTQTPAQTPQRSQANAPATVPATRPDPLDAQASVPPARYASPFAPYRRLSDDPPTAWREANDTVNRIGGWRAYAREASQPDAVLAPKPAQAASAAPAATPDRPAKPAPAGHGHHHTPGRSAP